MNQGYPSAREDDAEDVYWQLAVGATAWRAGEAGDAVVWLQRSAAAAIDAGHRARATELSWAASEMVAALDAARARPAAQPARAVVAPAAPAPMPVPDLHLEGREPSAPSWAASQDAADLAVAAVRAGSSAVADPWTLDEPGDDGPVDSPPTVVPPGDPAERVAAAFGTQPLTPLPAFPLDDAPSAPSFDEDVTRPLDVQADDTEEVSEAEFLDDDAVELTTSSEQLAGAAAAGPALSPVASYSDSLDVEIEVEAPAATGGPARARGGEDATTVDFPIDALPPEALPDELRAIAAAPLAEPEPPAGLHALAEPAAAEPERFAEPDTMPAALEAATVVPEPSFDAGSPWLEGPFDLGAELGGEIAFDETGDVEPESSAAEASFDDIAAFGDLPDDVREDLVARAVVTRVDADEELPAAGLLYVLSGAAAVSLNVADSIAKRVHAGDVVFPRGTVGHPLALRLVGLPGGAKIAAWSEALIDEVLATCPWVLDELRAEGDKLLALAGATLGPLGDRLDESLRGIALEHLDVRPLAPGERIVREGEPVPGVAVVGVGSVVLERGGGRLGEIGPGGIVLANEVLAGGPASASAKAGPDGAVVLFGARKQVHAMLVSCPPVLEIFAGM